MQQICTGRFALSTLHTANQRNRHCASAQLEWSYIDTARSGVHGIVQTATADTRTTDSVADIIILHPLQHFKHIRGNRADEPQRADLLVLCYRVHIGHMSNAEPTLNVLSKRHANPSERPVSAIGGIIKQAKKWLKKQQHNEDARV